MQIIVYTGAVLMLFLFVLMIVGVSAADSLRETIRGQRLWAGLAAIALLVLLTLIVGHAAIGPAAPALPSYGAGNVNRIATLIFTRYFFPFEVTSALLITAALGAMVLAHRERTSPKPTQRDLSRLRVAGGAPDAAAGAGHLRPPQRGGLPGAAARRHPGGAVGQPGHLRAPRRPGGGQRGAPGGGWCAAGQPGGHGPARPAGPARRPGAPSAEGSNGNGQEGARS